VITSYYVVTPAYDSYGEWSHDVVEVLASNKRKAKVKGLQKLRHGQSGWLKIIDGNPFAGLSVYPRE
jgi:hypothetical protein